jgi:hypothetical protein
MTDQIRYCRRCRTAHVFLQDVGADRYPPMSRQEWREIGYALIVWVLVLFALFYALPILGEGMR